jgi:hypothetical protein
MKQEKKNQKMKLRLLGHWPPMPWLEKHIWRFENENMKINSIVQENFEINFFQKVKCNKDSREVWKYTLQFNV